MPRYNTLIQMLIAPICILLAHINTECIMPAREEKAELLHWGALMDHNIQELMRIVKAQPIAKGFAKTVRVLISKSRGRQSPDARNSRSVRVIGISL